MVSGAYAVKTEINTSITMECPICHSVFQLVHIEPSGMHELINLVEAAHQANLDIPLPTPEEIQEIRSRVNRWFYQVTKNGGRHDVREGD